MLRKRANQGGTPPWRPRQTRFRIAHFLAEHGIVLQILSDIPSWIGHFAICATCSRGYGTSHWRRTIRVGSRNTGTAVGSLFELRPQDHELPSESVGLRVARAAVVVEERQRVGVDCYYLWSVVP